MCDHACVVVCSLVALDSTWSGIGTLQKEYRQQGGAQVGDVR